MNRSASKRIGAALEWATVALCLWAGIYHTPVGALMRATLVWMLPVGAGDPRGLLSYYSGGVQPPVIAIRALALPADVSALAAGAFTGYRTASPDVQARARSTLMTLGVDVQRLGDPLAGARTMQKAIARLRTDGATDAVALLSLFAGPEPARFAAQRARAEHRGLALEDLGRQLPPGYGDALTATASALAYSVAHGLAWPVHRELRTTSPFGYREHPVSGEQKMHEGIDLGMPIGTVVAAAAPGVVTRSSYDPSNGHIVVVAHGYDVQTLYLHNSERLVSVGDVVAAGSVLAKSGATGIVTGPHLHFQLELFSRPIDPEPFKR